MKKGGSIYEKNRDLSKRYALNTPLLTLHFRLSACNKRQQIAVIIITTPCPKKQYTKLMAITLSILNGFSKFFHC